MHRIGEVFLLILDNINIITPYSLLVNIILVPFIGILFFTLVLYIVFLFLLVIIIYVTLLTLFIDQFMVT